MDSNAEIAQIRGALKELIIEWERFFAGDRKTPPLADRNRIGKSLRTLAEKGGRHAEQFQVNQLQHRFMSFSQLWERQLREREEGRTSVTRRAATSPRKEPATQAQAAPAPNAEPRQSVEETEMTSLFERFVSAKRKVGEDVQVDAKNFSAQIDAQRKKLEARLGQKVAFDVVVNGDKVKLAARRAAKE